MSKCLQIDNVEVFSTCHDNNVSGNIVWKSEFTVDFVLPSALCDFTRGDKKGAEVAFGHKSGHDNFDVTVNRTKAETLCFHSVMWTHLSILFSVIIGEKNLLFTAILEDSVCRSWMLPKCQNAKYLFYFSKRINFNSYGKESLFTRWGRQRDMIQAKGGSCWVVNKIQYQM